MNDVTDDLGASVSLTYPVSRVVSLVPSLTEAIAATRPQALVGATDWCTHPADLDVPRVRGTKNPDLVAIAALRPDLVITNREENRRLDVERLRARGIPVWTTVIESVPQALTALHRLFGEALQWGVPPWLHDASTVWAGVTPTPTATAAVLVWRDPWMAVGSATFTGDLLGRLGLRNVFGDSSERYPHVTVDEVQAREPDVVVLPDEPYRFTAEDGPEAFPGRRCALVPGRLLTWYGPSLLAARSELAAALGL